MVDSQLSHTISLAPLHSAKLVLTLNSERLICTPSVCMPDVYHTCLSYVSHFTRGAHAACVQVGGNVRRRSVSDGGAKEATRQRALTRHAAVSRPAPKPVASKTATPALHLHIHSAPYRPAGHPGSAQARSKPPPKQSPSAPPLPTRSRSPTAVALSQKAARSVSPALRSAKPVAATAAGKPRSCSSDGRGPGKMAPAAAVSPLLARTSASGMDVESIKAALRSHTARIQALEAAAGSRQPTSDSKRSTGVASARGATLTTTEQLEVEQLRGELKSLQAALVERLQGLRADTYVSTSTPGRATGVGAAPPLRLLSPDVTPFHANRKASRLPAEGLASPKLLQEPQQNGAAQLVPGAPQASGKSALGRGISPGRISGGGGHTSITPNTKSYSSTARPTWRPPSVTSGSGSSGGGAPGVPAYPSNADVRALMPWSETPTTLTISAGASNGQYQA